MKYICYYEQTHLGHWYAEVDENGKVRTTKLLSTEDFEERFGTKIELLEVNNVYLLGHDGVLDDVVGELVNGKIVWKPAYLCKEQGHPNLVFDGIQPNQECLQFSCLDCETTLTRQYDFWREQGIPVDDITANPEAYKDAEFRVADNGYVLVEDGE
jgi:hypothetical protein